LIVYVNPWVHNMSTLLKIPSLIRSAGALKRPLRAEHYIVAGILLIAAILGLITPAFVDVSNGQVSKMVALPAAMLFGLMLIYDRRLSLMFIMLFRSGADNVLELTRLSVGSYPLGVGGLINGFVILIAILLVFEKPKQAPASAYAAWLPFLGMLLLGVLISPVKGDALRLFLAVLSHFAMFIAGFHCVRDKREFRQLLTLIVCSSIVPVLYSAVDFALHHGMGEFRLQSTFSHPNVLAFYTTIVIGAAFYLLKSLPKGENPGQKVVLTAYIFVLLGVLLLTQTRSAWTATAITFTIYALLFERRFLLYMFVLGAVALMIPGVFDRIADLGQGNTVKTNASLNSFAWRVYLWQTGLGWMRPSAYMLGNGLLSFKEYSQIFFPLAGKMKWGAHSVYVEIIFELGLAGLLSFCWLYLKVLLGLVKLIKIDPLAAFSLIVIILNFLICCFSDNMLDYLSYAWYLWFAVGAGCALVPTFARSARGIDPRRSGG
jgi:O-antigen ligase